MGKSTFSAVQRKFLVDQVPAFREAQQASTVPSFFAQLYTDWFERWPTADDLNDHGEDGDSVAGSDDHHETERESIIKKLKNWFYNCRIGKQPEDERPFILNLTHRKKRLQKYQAYVKLFGSYVCPVINARYRELLRHLPAGITPPDRLKFMQIQATAMLAGESEEVQAAVESYRILGEIEEPDEDMKVKERRRAIISLPKTIQVACDNIEKETGWFASIFLGGPNGTTGEIMTYVYHNGRTIETEQPWDEFEPGFQEVAGSWSSYVSRCFKPPPDKSKKLRLGKAKADPSVAVTSWIPQAGVRKEDSSSAVTPGPSDPAAPKPIVLSDSSDESDQEDPDLDLELEMEMNADLDDGESERELSFDEQRDVWIKKKETLLRKLGLDQVFLGPSPSVAKGRKKVHRPWENEGESEEDEPGASGSHTTSTNRRTHPPTRVSPRNHASSSVPQNGSSLVSNSVNSASKIDDSTSTNDKSIPTNDKSTHANGESIAGDVEPTPTNDNLTPSNNESIVVDVEPAPPNDGSIAANNESITCDVEPTPMNVDTTLPRDESANAGSIPIVDGIPANVRAHLIAAHLAAAGSSVSIPRDVIDTFGAAPFVPAPTSSPQADNATVSSGATLLTSNVVTPTASKAPLAPTDTNLPAHATTPITRHPASDPSPVSDVSSSQSLSTTESPTVTVESVVVGNAGALPSATVGSVGVVTSAINANGHVTPSFASLSAPSRSASPGSTRPTTTLLDDPPSDDSIGSTPDPSSSDPSVRLSPISDSDSPPDGTVIFGVDKLPPRLASPSSATSSDSGVGSITADLNIPLPSMPSFWRDAFYYLLALSSDSIWRRLVVTWINIESVLGYPGNMARLPTRFRPEEVARFLQWGRKYVKAPTLTASRIQPYAATWKLWWESLQPEWREVGEMADSTVEVSEKDWGVLVSGGNNGLYIVIISLGWWFAAVSRLKSEQPAEWEDAKRTLVDVDWVFTGVLSHAQREFAPVPRKRAAAEAHAGLSKRSRKA